MKLFSIPLFVLSCVLFISHVSCDIAVFGPTSDDTYKPSDGTVSVPLKWADDANSPDISTAKSITFVLCTGNNTDIQGLVTFGPFDSSSDITEGAYYAEFDDTVGSSGNYFFQFYTTYGSDQYTIHYSERFELEDMTGTLEATGEGDPPASEVSVAASVNSASFTVPYTKQTGRTRYAPMQMQPGTTVTATTWSRRFPSSSVTYFTTLGGSANVYSTITPGWSYTASSKINYASPAPFPSAVGWYSAEQKLVSATLDSSLKKIKKRRWDDE